MQLPEMNVGKASPTLHDVSIWSATTEEEFHFQQLKRVKQVPQVHANAVFPHGVAAAMFFKRRSFERARHELQMNSDAKDMKDTDLEFWRLTAFKLTLGIGEISKTKESKPVQNKLRNTENLHETWTPDPNVESACHQFVIHLCWMPHDVACSFSLCRCYGNSEKKNASGLPCLKGMWHSLWILKRLQQIPWKNKHDGATELCRQRPRIVP